MCICALLLVHADLLRFTALTGTDPVLGLAVQPLLAADAARPSCRRGTSTKPIPTAIIATTLCSCCARTVLPSCPLQTPTLPAWTAWLS
jgi:hypothetical protein